MEHFIALLTDFGAKGQHYVAAMKAHILKINPDVNIIDLSHEISSYSILEASYILKTNYNHFPEGTIFIIVVDPGVGSSREILALRTNSNYFFIGPNNGIFPQVFDSAEISECVVIQNVNYFSHPVSSTFHGRDIMAPIGAHIAKDTSPLLSNYGSSFSFGNLLSATEINKLEIVNNLIMSSIQYIDSFGNGVTTVQVIGNKIKSSELILEYGSKILFTFKRKNYKSVYTSHFSEVPRGSLLCLVGSAGYLEISVNQGNASERLGFEVGDNIVIKIVGEN
ncbi:MAG: SAM hydrolase/SAM-dependent halogenase family protein [Promethearchaeota archaeon]|jgi:S-adenosylmethionine hydrolase